MNNRCLDTLEWFIARSQKDQWFLHYDKSLDLKVFGIISACDYDSKAYEFQPVLHRGQRVYEVVIKN